MTKRKGSLAIIEKDDLRICSECDMVEECRPYGKGGALVCFECAMKDEDRTKRQFRQRVLGERVN